jgi:hypothetical protein
MAHGVIHGTTTIDESAAGEVSLVAVAATAHPVSGNWRTRITSIWIDATDSTVGGIARIKVDLGATGVTQRTIRQYDYAFVAGRSINLLSIGPIDVDTDVEILIVRPGTGAAGVDIHYRIEIDTAVDKIQAAFNDAGDTDEVNFTVEKFEMNNDSGPGVLAQSQDGDGAQFTSNGGNGNGATFTGNGSGHGAQFIKGATGKDIDSTQTDIIQRIYIIVKYIKDWIDNQIVKVLRRR